jgi:hypothetical protein
MIDFSNIPVLDFHGHIPGPNNLTKVVDILFTRWLRTAVSDDIYEKYNNFTKNMGESNNRSTIISKEDFIRENKIDRLREQFKDQLQSIPSFNGFLKYVSRFYGCEANIFEIDEVMNEKLKNPCQYMSEVLSRENIQTVVLDLFGETEIDDNYFPSEKAFWVYRIDKMIRPSWLRENGFSSFNQLLDTVGNNLNLAVKKGCVAFKSAITYSRNVRLSNPTFNQARDAFTEIRDSLNQNEKTVTVYQDYVLKTILNEAGNLDKPFLFHFGVGGPGPRPNLRNIDPDDLRSILDDPELRKTKIVMLHCSYPYEKKAAVMTYQYSNLFVDLSIPTFFHGNLSQTLMTYLEFTPHKKIFYGSDAWHTPELFAYDSYFFKKELKNTLSKLSHRYEMTEEDVIVLSRKILSENAKEFLKINM